MTVGSPSFALEMLPLFFDLEMLLDSRAPLAFGSSGDGTLRVRDETGSRSGAIRRDSWGSSRRRDSSRGRRPPLESMLEAGLSRLQRILEMDSSREWFDDCTSQLELKLR